MLSFTAQQISDLVHGEIIGSPQATVNDLKPIETAQAGALCYIYDKQYIHLLNDTKASVVIISRELTEDIHTDATLIIVDNARATMALLLQAIEKMLHKQHTGVEQPAYIASNVVIPDSAYIGAFTYIGTNVRLGQGVQIYPNCYIGDNVQIGDNTIIYAGAKIYHDCILGNNCILHAGVVIGADGFGFEPDQAGVNQKLPQLGNVIIEDDVEIGANSTVDRAMLGSTIIRKNVKIDNLVQIAHSVEIGESTFVCAQVGIAGSTQIGNHCILAGQVGVAGHIKIADHSIFGAQAGIAGTINKSGVYQGSPAFDAHQWRRAVAVFKHLPEIDKDIFSIKKTLDETTHNK